MAKLVDGLYGYEIVLGSLGSLLFLALIPLLLRQIWLNRQSSGLLLFFGLSLVMIGFPGIKSFQFGKDVLTLETKARELQENPTDPALRKEVAERAEDVSKRPTADPKTKTTVAQAQFELGDHAAAEATVDQVLKDQPQNDDARKLKDRIVTDRKLRDLSQRVEQNPADTAAKQQLETVTHEVSKQRVASPEMLTNLAASEAAIGHEKEAAELNKKALAINPNLQRAKDLQRRIDATNK